MITLPDLIEVLEARAALKIGATKLIVLSFLAAHPQKLQTLTVLASLASVSTAAMTGTIDSLESSGLVIRERTPIDRRTIFARLTAKGAGVLIQLGIEIPGVDPSACVQPLNAA